MQNFKTISILLMILFIPKLASGQLFWVNIVGGPDRACEGTIHEYTIHCTPNSGLLTLECTDCLIKDPDDGTWDQVIVINGYVNNFEFDVKFDQNFGQATIYANLNFIPGITRTDYQFVNEGAPIVTAATITGDDFLANCNSVTNGYGLTNISSGWTLDDWTVQYPLTTSNETGSSVNVSTTNTTSYGLSTLTAEMIYYEQGVNCGNQDIEFDIWYGKPSNANIRIVDYATGYPPSSLCSNSYNNYLKAEHTLDISPVSNWDWQSSYNWYLNYPDYPDKSIAQVSTDNNSGTVGIRAYNACGWSNWINYQYYVYSCGYFMTLYPNPSSSELNIDVKDGSAKIDNMEKASATMSNSNSKELKFDLKILGSQKEVFYQKNNVTSPYKVNTTSFNSGIYIVNVIIGDEVLKETIVIE